MREFLPLPPGESSYQRGVYLFLSSYRFFSFALAIALIFTIPKKEMPIDWQMLLIIGLVGAYTALKILFRFRLWQTDLLTYTILGGDLAVCLTLILVTWGVDSPFLLYSLQPIITAALFFGLRVSLVMAGLTSLSIILSHTVLAGINPGFAPILAGNYLTFVLVYCFFCLLAATIPYQANLNVYRHIQGDAIAEERRRLRREIHDGIAQVLGYLGTKTNLIKKMIPPSDEKLLAELDEIHQVTLTSYEDIRAAIDSLDMKAGSLITVLSSHTEQLGKRIGAKTEFNAPQQLAALHPTAQLQLLRIGQEALNNIRKHATATQIWVRLESTPQSVILVVKDNGRGFSPSERRGTGLRIMEERANSINGTLTITSSPEQGTEVRVKVPRR